MWKFSRLRRHSAPLGMNICGKHFNHQILGMQLVNKELVSEVTPVVSIGKIVVTRLNVMSSIHLSSWVVNHIITYNFYNKECRGREDEEWNVNLNFLGIWSKIHCQYDCGRTRCRWKHSVILNYLICCGNTMLYFINEQLSVQIWLRLIRH